MENQPTLNIGCLGNVSDGKSTLVYSLTNEKTQKHSSEQIRNISIKLGYANCKIYLCDKCEYPENIYSTTSEIFRYECPKCNNDTKLVKHFSFVDCPGHNDLLMTMLNSIDILDAGIFVIGANDKLENKKQLEEHLQITKILSIKDYIVCLNKADLVSNEILSFKYQQIKKKMEEYSLDPPIIPTCFNYGINKEYLLHYLKDLPEIDKSQDKLKIRITRSFDINKAGIKISDLKGGVIGGSIISGSIKINDIIKIYPGYIIENKYYPLTATVTSLKSGNNNLTKAITGGLIAIGLDIDPNITKNDNLIGHTIIMTNDDNIPKVYIAISLELTWINQKDIKINEHLYLSINSKNITGKVVKIIDNKIMLYLNSPSVLSDNLIPVSFKDNNYQIIAYGKFIAGKSI